MSDVDEGQEWEPELEDDGILQPADSLAGTDLAADPLDSGYLPADRYGAAIAYGTTLDEQRRGESLTQLLAEEEPDVPSGQGEESDLDSDPSPRAGRLVRSDEDGFALDVGIDGAAASAEEAAVHIVEDAPYPVDERPGLD